MYHSFLLTVWLFTDTCVWSCLKFVKELKNSHCAVLFRQIHIHRVRVACCNQWHVVWICHLGAKGTASKFVWVCCDSRMMKFYQEIFPNLILVLQALHCLSSGCHPGSSVLHFLCQYLFRWTFLLTSTCILSFICMYRLESYLLLFRIVIFKSYRFS